MNRVTPSRRCRWRNRRWSRWTPTTARRYIGHFGLEEDLLPPTLSRSLGTASLPPLMRARGYAAFPNGGFRINPYFFDEVRDRDGQVVFAEKPPTACPACGVGSSGGTTVQAANEVAGFNFGPEAAAPPAEPADGDGEGATTSAAPERLPADTVLAPRAIDARVALPIWIDYMRVALEGRPVAANDPPDGMVRVTVGQGGRLLPEGSGGIAEWVKAEDLERMQVDAYTEYDESASEQEEAFDIF